MNGKMAGWRFVIVEERWRGKRFPLYQSERRRIDSPNAYVPYDPPRPILGGPKSIGKCALRGIARNGETFGAKSCEKDAWWKNQTATFPPRLEIPRTPRGIPTFRTASAAAVCMTNTYRTKGDISIVLKQGTFLMHYDINCSTLDFVNSSGAT